MTLRLTSASTESLPVHQRCAYWESYSSDSLVDLKCTPYAAQGLVAQQHNIWSRDLGLSVIVGNQHVIERTQTHIQRTPKASVFVSFDFISAAFFYQGKTCHSVQPNDMVIYRTDQPYLFGFKHKMRQVIIGLPESGWQFTSEQQLNQPLKIRAQASTHRLLMRTLATQCRHFVAQPKETQLVSLREQVSWLLADILAFQTDSAGSSALSSSYVLAARQFITEQLTRAELNNAQIAAAVGVSERHLQRLFAEALQSSIQEYIMRQRLDRALWLLRHSSHKAYSVERIAFEVGFSSLAHFSRRFKQHFGTAPSRLRA